MRTRVVAALLTTAALLGTTAFATDYDWQGGSGSWDDVTTTNWNPNGIPGNTDRVFIRQDTAGDITITYDTTVFDSGSNKLEYLYVDNNGGGATTFEVATGDVVRVDGTFVIDNGVRYVQTGGTNILSRDVGGGGDLYWANSDTDVTEIEISGGYLEGPPSGYRGLCQRGTSTFTVSGDADVYSVATWYVGDASGTHNWTIAGGTFRPNVLVLGGGSGSVTLMHTGGVVRNASVTLQKGSLYDLAITNMAVGYMRPNKITVNGGEFIQRGGAITNSWDVWVAAAKFTTGTYTMVSGRLQSNEDLEIGVNSNCYGTFDMTRSCTGAFSRQLILGTDTTGRGRLLIHGGRLTTGNYPQGPIRCYLGGLIRGWGFVSGDVWTRNRQAVFNGVVIADGEGSDRSLDLRWADIVAYYMDLDRSVHNLIDNTSTNGWYAVNGGKLSLPKPWVVPPGGTPTVQGTYEPSVGPTNVYWWGESIGDDGIDMVNSARITFSGMGTVNGELDGALCAADRTDVPAGLWLPVGIWTFTNVNFTFTTAEITFRYDDGAVAAQEVPEGALRVWHYTGGGWQDITAVAGLDTVNKRITSQPVSSFSMFAVAAREPPSATLILIK